MEAVINSQFFYRGKHRPAQFFFSFDEDVAFVFTILQDEELIERFGTDADFQTNGEQILFNPTIIDPEYFRLQSAILESVKTLPHFKQGRTQLKTRQRA